MKQLSALGNRRHYYRNATRIPIDNNMQQQQQQQNRSITDLMNINTNSNSTQLLSSTTTTTTRGNRFDMINENSEIIGQNNMNYMSTGKEISNINTYVFLFFLQKIRIFDIL